VRDEDDCLVGALGRNASPTAGLHLTCELGRSSLRSTSDCMCSSVTVDGSQTVLGSGIVGFSILPSSNPMLMDLKVTNDFTCMRGCCDGGSKLDGALTSLNTARRRQTLVLRGNGSKWRPPGPRGGLI
jgi:hypothetical protein